MSEFSYYHQNGREPLIYKTLGQILDEATKKKPNTEAIIDFVEEKRLTFAQFNNEVNNFAAGLRSLGFQKNDRIVIWSLNSIEWCVAFYASARAGLIATSLNPLYQVVELEYSLNKIRAKGIILAKSFRHINFYGTLSNVCPELGSCEPGKLKSIKVPSLQHVITVTEEKFPGALRYNDILKLATKGRLDEIKKLRNEIQPEDACNIQFTSGTTGLPKATVLSHFALINDANGIGQFLDFPNECHKICAQVPLFHILGTVGVIGVNVLFASTVVLASPAYSPTKSLESIEKEKCTITFGTPTMFADLAKLQNENKFEVSTLKKCFIGGAATSEELFGYIAKTFNMKIVKAYGMTELSGAVYVDDGAKKGCLGPLLDHMQIKVVDKNNRIVPLGTPGELCVRGYNMLGYWEDDVKTKEITLEGGWLKTGDQFILYPNGYGSMVGRIKDMINRGGENIFPKEVEDYICQIPGVLECTVFGIPDDRLGEEVCAAIRIEDKATIGVEKVAKFCSDKIASYKIPRHLKILNDFPRTPTGKIKKGELQDMMSQELKKGKVK